jgi:hypothetical protein
MNETDQTPFSSMLGTPGMPPQDQAAGYSDVVNQPHPIIQEMNTPATSPQEFEKRKAGWQMLVEKLQTDPNLQRAVGFAGAALVQPRQPGQTNLGQIGQAYMVGQSAYTAGEYSKYEQDLKSKEEARKTSESQASVDLTKARTPGVAAESAVSAQTVDTRVQAAKAALEQSQLALKKATSQEQVDALHRDIQTRRAQIEKDIPEESVRKSILAEYDKVLADVTEKRAKAAQEQGKADMSKLTVDIVKGMDKEEQKQFLTKSGRYSGSQSAVAQQRDMWGQIYDKLPDDDAHKKGKSREQFVLQQLTAAKAKDATELLVKAKTAGLSDEEIDSLGLFDLAKQAAAERRGATAQLGATPGATQMVWDPAQKKYVPAKK